jgi:cobalt-zinc-cadmium efflux system outer membrane protein
MIHAPILRFSITVVAVALLSACAALPRDRGRAEVESLLAANGHALPSHRGDDDAMATSLESRLSKPLGPDDAVEIAWLESPRIRMRLAELGLAAADLFDAGRLRNPTLSASRIGGSDGTTTVGISAIVTDLLTLPSRSRIGRSHWQSAVAQTAHALVDEAAMTRADYYALVGATQVAAMRDAIADAGDTSAELARRFHAAGNISALQLAREEAAATLARTEAAKARAERIAARMALAERLGLAGRTNRWRTATTLPLPPTEDPDVDTLLALGRERRLDIAAARTALDAGVDTATFARRFAWLGEIELGFERERENGERESGPFLSLELPLFRQGQSDRARATAERDVAREQLALFELAIQRHVRGGAARLTAQREIVASYRDALIPQREAIVARELERYNFMLIGAFELIQARQEEYDAYQGYVEAIRDYWLARVELARAVGGRLPGDDMPLEDAPSVDELLRPSSTRDATHDHHAHGPSD